MLRPHAHRHLLALASIVLAGCSEGGPTEPTSRPPTVSVSVSATGGLQGATAFAFTADASDADGDALSYTWDFGDQSTATGSNVTHVYQTSGSFTARVNVSDGKNTVSGEAAVTVKNLTGVWTSAPVSNPNCNYEWILTLVQSGTTLNGAMGLEGLSACPGMSFGVNPVSGSVQTSSPTVRWSGHTVSPNFENNYTAEVNGAVSILTGITIGSCSTHPITGVETCTNSAWSFDPLTRR